MKLSPKSVFRKYYNGKNNFMTPEIIEQEKAYETKDTYVVYEISEGYGFDKHIYGVTFLEVMKGSNEIKRMSDINQMCYSLEEAKAHVKTVIDDAKGEEE